MTTLDRGADLGFIVRHARCLLWYARVEQRDGHMLWQREIASEEAAQNLLPLAVGAGETYDAAWMRSRHLEDRALMDRKSRDALRAGMDGYSQDFRCTDSYGHVHWLHEDVSIQSISPDCWRLSGVCVQVGERKRSEERANLGLALEKLRNAVLKMDCEGDWIKVIEVAHYELRMLVLYDRCSVNMIDREADIYFSYFFKDSIVQRCEGVGPIPPVLVHAMETGETVYRRNGDEIRAWRIHPERIDIQAVVDAPFLGGTLAISSYAEEAFSQRDIAVAQEFAQVLSEGHRRLQDLQRLAQQERQLTQVQRLELVDQLTAGIAHELNNPLTKIMGYAQLILRRHPTDEYKKWVEEIFRGSMEAAAIVRRLQLFSQEQGADKQVIDLSETVRRAIELVRHHFAARGVEIVDELATDMPSIIAQPGQIQQLVLHLLNNSLDAIVAANRRGHIWVRSYLAGNALALDVCDDGPGVDAAQRQRVFEPFFTTKDVGKGKGLGLSMCYGIAREHGGTTYLTDSDRGTGARFVLELPLPLEEETSATPHCNRSEEMGNYDK